MNQSGLDHPALLYAGEDDFLESMVPYLLTGLERGEAVFVAARADNVAALRSALGPVDGGLRMADTAEWHPHTASRLRAFHDMVKDRLSEGAPRVRLAGEPVWPSEPPELVREWQRYESVLNAVLAPFPVTLVCLYDASMLDAAILETARRTHPVVRRRAAQEPSREFEPPEAFLGRWISRLEPPPPRAARATDPNDLAAARYFVGEQALGAGVGPTQTGELGTAVTEILTNALVHGGGPAALRTWVDGDWFVCQVEDEGQGVADPLAGYHPPRLDAVGGRGLWLARQLVDLLLIDADLSGTTVRLHVDRS